MDADPEAAETVPVGSPARAKSRPVDVPRVRGRNVDASADAELGGLATSSDAGGSLELQRTSATLDALALFTAADPELFPTPFVPTLGDVVFANASADEPFRPAQVVADARTGKYSDLDSSVFLLSFLTGRPDVVEVTWKPLTQILPFSHSIALYLNYCDDIAVEMPVLRQALAVFNHNKQVRCHARKALR